MSTIDIKKINVRSPYYISVSKDETADTPITEPQVLDETLACGGTVTAGVSVGVREFKIDISDRIIGDFTVTISGVKVPIRYRLGYAANMPSFATVGWNDYQEAWTNATNETTGLVPSSSYPNGVSVDAVYTSTQSDIATYGTTIKLQIQQPLQTDGYSISLACPVRKNDADAVDGGFVTMINVQVAPNIDASNIRPELFINNTSIGNLSTGMNRFIMSDVSPNILPEGYIAANTTIQPNFYNSNDDNVGSLIFKGGKLHHSHFKKPSTGSITERQVKVSYLAETFLGSGINNLKITTPKVNGRVVSFRVLIARHPVVDVGGVLTIQGSDDGIDISCLVSEGSLVSDFSVDREDFVMDFNGSNSVELAAITSIIESYFAGETYPEIFPIPTIDKVIKGI